MRLAARSRPRCCVTVRACAALLCDLQRRLDREDSPDCALSSSPAGKYVVLFFYPLDFTFVCPVRALAGRSGARLPLPASSRKLFLSRTALDASHSRLQTEICAFSDAAAEFEKHNCVVRTLLRRSSKSCCSLATAAAFGRLR